MTLGLIGLGVVGSTLQKWLLEHTQHTLKLYDPPKGLQDDLTDCDAIFISVPVAAAFKGQDISVLEESVRFAKKFTDLVFIRSTVLPGTCDKLGAYSMPEFLTERRAYEDFCKYRIIAGAPPREQEGVKDMLEIIFHPKAISVCSNVEAELAKFTHNCFGALKVTYFNMIHRLCEHHCGEYEAVLGLANITGFLGNEHLQVPGPDGKFGYGGKCFPENVDALLRHTRNQISYDWDVELKLISEFFLCVKTFNETVRGIDK